MAINEHAELVQVIARLERQRDELSGAILALRSVLGEPTTDESQLVPLKRAAGETQFSRETIRQWLCKRVIIGRQVGGRWFVSERSLDHHIRQRSACR